MQAIYLIKQLTSGVATALRKRQSERLSAALTRELSLADPLMRADIQMLIEYATPSVPPAADSNGDREPAPTSDAAHMQGGFRATPLPGLPTHMRYSSS